MCIDLRSAGLRLQPPKPARRRDDDGLVLRLNHCGRSFRAVAEYTLNSQTSCLKTSDRLKVVIRYSGSVCCTLWLGAARIFALEEMFRDAFCSTDTQGDHTHAIKRRQANEADR